MKNVFVCFCFVFFIATTVAAQSDWIDYKIDNKLTIKVPSQPTTADDYSVVATGKDSLVCVITKIDMQQVSGLDSAALADLAPTTDFISSIKSGMGEKMKGYTLGNVRTSKWNGHFAYYVDGTNDAEKVKSFSFLLIIGDNLYSFSAVMPDDQSTQPKDDFFSSLKLN